MNHRFKSVPPRHCLWRWCPITRTLHPISSSIAINRRPIEPTCKPEYSGGGLKYLLKVNILIRIYRSSQAMPTGASLLIWGTTYKPKLSYYLSYIQSYDVACNGSAEVTIGPIRLDPTVKQLIEGALYSRSLRSHVKIIDKISTRSADMILTDRIIRIID